MVRKLKKKKKRIVIQLITNETPWVFHFMNYFGNLVKISTYRTALFFLSCCVSEIPMFGCGAKKEKEKVSRRRVSQE